MYPIAGVVYGVRWDGRGRGVVLALVLAFLAAMAVVALGAPAHERLSTVVVLGDRGSASAERAVQRAGGSVERRIELVDGVVARVPSRRLAALDSAAGVASVVEDRSFSASNHDEVDPGATALTGAPVSLADVRRATRADEAGSDGSGIDVALVDSGVTPVGALSAPGKVVNGPDVSFDDPNPALRNLDAFGHGTHLAGIIAGEGGMAPGARIISVKTADSEGQTSLIELLVAVDWVVRNRNTGGRNIRVLTLAVGSDSNGSYSHDPLALAAERAWQAGIVVVAAGGNEARSGLDLPAADPYLLAVGATDAVDPANPDDDVVQPWSNRGSRGRNPDVVAPGTSIVSQRVPGSVVDEAYPEGRVGEDGFRGSGTSQAAAVTAGAAALVVARRPELNPDQVKAVLRAGAHTLAADPAAQGNGALDAAASAGADVPAGAEQWFPRSRGRGGRRGHRIDFGIGSGWLGRRWTGRRWTAEFWNGRRWSGVKWSGVKW